MAAVREILSHMTLVDVRFAVKHIFCNRTYGMISPAQWNITHNYDVLTERIFNRIKSTQFCTYVLVKQIMTLLPMYKTNVIPTKYLISLLATIDYIGTSKTL